MLNRRQLNVPLFSILVLALFASIPAPVEGGARFGHQIYAIPAFSRQYGTSCSTCHVDFPKLNDFGKAALSFSRLALMQRCCPAKRQNLVHFARSSAWRCLAPRNCP